MEGLKTKTADQQLASKPLSTPLKEAHDYIYAIDFSKIIDKLVKREKWLQSEAEEACRQYRNYLYLLRKHENQGPLPPSEDIDEFWHNHILDTYQYVKDCSSIFGKYLHHYPYLGMDEKTNMQDLQNYFSKTQQRYKQEFGCEITVVRCRGLAKWVIKALLLIQSIFQGFSQARTRITKPKKGVTR